MPLPYSQNKKHIMKWRANNREQNNLISKMYMRQMRCWKKIQFEFYSILIDDWNVASAC